jgi:UDP-N-acetylglucosamine 2-epimerase (non-hydrolysing)
MPSRPVLVVAGTRPEAIKLAPLVQQLRRSSLAARVIVCVSGQHSEAVHQQLSEFGVRPEIVCHTLPHPVDLGRLVRCLLDQLSRVMDEVRPTLVIVQGDTATTLAAARAAARRGSSIAHVEAGLRTGSLASPFPEEAYRKAIATTASLHFAPTPLAAANLTNEGVAPEIISMTGNTGVDAFRAVSHAVYRPRAATTRRVLVSLHRREILGAPLQRMFEAVGQLAHRYPAVEFVCHLNENPAVRRAFDAAIRLWPSANIVVKAPASYIQFLNLIASSDFVMTDSGGIQEDAPLLGKPVLVLREHTDRSEGVDAGVAWLVGTRPEAVVSAATDLMENEKRYEPMARVCSPFGDGLAAHRICRRVVELCEQHGEVDGR